MAILFIRTLILYFLILVSMRLMGKRQLGEMELSEFIVAALTADLAATPLQDIGTPLLNGLVPIITLFSLEILIAGLSLKSVKARGLIFGRPEIIIKNGRINTGAMRSNRFTVDELMQELRSKSFIDISEIQYAILETNGQLNVIPYPDKQPLTPNHLGISADDPGYPHIIISEGRVLDNNLRLTGRDQNWLAKQLNGRSPEEIYLFMLTDTGKTFCQQKDVDK